MDVSKSGGGIGPGESQVKLESSPWDGLLWQRLEWIRASIGASHRDFCEMLGMTQKTYDLVENRQAGFSIQNLVRLADSLGLSLQCLLENQIDYDALATQFGNHLPALPGRYEVIGQKLSKVRSVQTIFHSLILFRGSIFARQIFSRFQLNPFQFRNSNDNVSLLLIMDLLSELRKEGFSDEHLRLVGSRAADVNENNELGRLFSAFKTPKDLYRAMHEECMAYFDRNWRYRLVGLTDSGCTVEITVRPETEETFGNKKIGNREGCLCRQGIYTSILRHLKKYPAQITESQCMYVDGDRCLYHLHWA